MKLDTCVVLLVVCAGAGVADCPPDQIQCGRGGNCIYPRSWCNGVWHCDNGMDEDRCGCGSGHFQCDNKCILADHTCDGIPDCKDNWDEENCGRCNRGAIFCDDYCAVRCDGNPSCSDGHDEWRCTTCNGDAVFCDNRCVIRCNGVPDCTDGADEVDCTTCKENAFLCSSKKQCVPSEFKCDGIQNCADGSDELNCTSCSKNALHCSDNHCVQPEHKCDGVKWCVNGSDEVGCANVRAGHTVTACSAKSRCNGIPADCDWHDELGCTADMCRFPATKETFCGGRCLRTDQLCDGVKDCPDGSDEANCGPCSWGSVMCNGTCVERKHVCDGVRDCQDGLDEANCTSCKFGAFLCDGQRCVQVTHRCDGVKWCRGGSDEDHCNNVTAKSTACPAETRCDGFEGGCYSKDDEVGCSPDMCQAPASNQTYCDGRCIPASKWCDGVSDCVDLRDEADCHGENTTRESTNAEAVTVTSRRVPGRSSSDPGPRPGGLGPEWSVNSAILSQMSHIATVLNFIMFAFIVTVVMAVVWKCKNRWRRPPPHSRDSASVPLEIEGQA